MESLLFRELDGVQWLFQMAIYGLSTSERSIDLEIGIKGTDIHAVADFKIGDLIVRGHYTYWAGGLFPLHGRFGVGFDSIGCFTRIDVSSSFSVLEESSILQVGMVSGFRPDPFELFKTLISDRPRCASCNEFHGDLP